MAATFKIPRGSDRTWRLRAEDDGLPIDLTGGKLWATVKAIASAQAAGTYLFRRRNLAAGGSDAEIQIVAPATNGEYDLKCVPTNTSGLTPSDHDYVIDIFIETASGKRYQLVKGQVFEVELAVTTDFT